MNVRDGLPDFFGATQLPGLSKGKKPMKKKAPPAKPTTKKGPPKAKPQWQQISEQMTGKC